MNLTDFFSMGGYAPYVWGSFGVTLLVLVGEVVSLRRRRQALTQRLIIMRKIALREQHETTT
ncbi:hypothetical protein BH18ACI2_BH18ACI2_15730 [soil metagenome]